MIIAEVPRVNQPGTKTTDQMQNFETGAVRDTGGKGRMDLLPMSSLLRISKHMEDALSHYPERNWEQGMPMHCMLDSAFRHMAKYMMGMDDEDHLCAAATNLLMAMWTEDNLPRMQDIPSRRASVTPSLASDTQEAPTPVREAGGQGEVKRRPRKTTSTLCDCYDSYWERCNGTKEQDSCQCMGLREKCDFYPEVRNKANAQQG